jgi:hypothetical protein
MSTRFFTNHSERTLFKKFRGVFENNPAIERFDALVGYPLQQDNNSPVSAAARPLDTTPDIILSESFDQ